MSKNSTRQFVTAQPPAGLSGGAGNPLDELQTLTWDCETKELSISDGNTIPLNNCSCRELSRTQVLALRNAGTLDVSCVYKIPYSRGCLVDSSIYLKPSCNNLLSHDVDVETPFDNELWEGRYSIDSNRMLELFDQRGNRVGGQTGNEVDRWPWGQASVTQNEVFNADVYIDCDTTQVINGNEWTSNAYTDLRGFQGVFQDNSIDSYGRVYLNNATTVDFRRNKIQSFAYVYFNGGVDNIYVRQNTIADNSYVRKFAGNDQRFTLIDSLVARGDIRQQENAASLYLNTVDTLSGGRIYQYANGTLDMRTTTVSDNSFIENRHTGTPTTRIWYSSYRSQAYHYVRVGVTAGTANYYYCNFNSCTYDYRSGTANKSVYYHTQTANGYVRLDNITGTHRYYQNHIMSRCEMRLDTVANINAYYNTFQSYVGGLVMTRVSAQTTLYYNTFSTGQVRVTDQTGTVNFQGNGFHSYNTLTYTNNSSPIILSQNQFSSRHIGTIRNNAHARVALYSNDFGARSELLIENGTGGNVDIYYSETKNYRSRIELSAADRVYIYSLNLQTAGKYEVFNGQGWTWYSKISNNSRYRATGATSDNTRLYASNISEISTVNSGIGADTYASKIGCNVNLTQGTFNFNRSMVMGGPAVTLTADNNQVSRIQTGTIV